MTSPQAIVRKWEERAAREKKKRDARLPDEPEPGFKMASWRPPADWGEPDPHDRHQITSPEQGLPAELLSFPKVGRFIKRLRLPTLRYDNA